MKSVVSLVRHMFLPAMIMVLLGAAGAFAAAPNKPVEFTATVYGAPAAVKLTWQAAREGDKAEGFKVYAAPGETEDMSQFDMIQDTKESKAIVQNKTGVWTFFVRAYNADGLSDRSVIKVVNIKAEEQKIKFLTTPKTSIGANQEYVYEAKAVYGNTDQAVRYALVSGPDGMKINEETGRIEWTTGANGLYRVSVRAYLASNPDIYSIQEWKITVGNGGNDGDAFRFTSTPRKEGESGKEWVYEAKAVYTTDPNATIVYSLVEPPEGMTINPATGRIIWTPQRDGVYYIIVAATIDGMPDKKILQKFELKIGNGSGGGENSAIKFKGEPPSVACVGKEYIYNPTIINMLGAPVAVVFSLKDAPAGMTVDQTKGTVRWTPEREGDRKSVV